jgi:hypothetical protein
MDEFFYICNLCNFKTHRKHNYQQHIETQKHREMIQYKCEGCGKLYKHDSSLARHRNVCNMIFSKLVSNEIGIMKESIKELKETIPSFKNVLTTVVETNNQFQNKIMDSNNQFVKSLIDNNKSTLENVINACITIDKNRSNKKDNFNLNTYLNKTCKDAVNIEDFVDNVDPNYEDVICVGKCGYVEGNASVIIKYLNALEQSKRPIQCSDVKRQTVYLKSGGKWEKDEEGLPKTAHAVNRICNKTYKNKKLWTQKHPDYNDRIEYILLVKAVSGGGEDIDTMNTTISKKIIKQCAVKK